MCFGHLLKARVSCVSQVRFLELEKSTNKLAHARELDLGHFTPLHAFSFTDNFYILPEASAAGYKYFGQSPPPLLCI